MNRVLTNASLSALVVALALACGTSAADATTVSVVPPDTTVLVGGSFAVRIEIDAIADLKGMELIFSYNPATLQLLGVDPGDVLTGSGRAFSAYVVPDLAPADSIWYDAAMLDGTTSGPGIIAFFRFKALHAGDSPIQCRKVDCRDLNNVQTLPDCVSGMVRVTAPTSARATSWSRLKMHYW